MFNNRYFIGFRWKSKMAALCVGLGCAPYFWQEPMIPLSEFNKGIFCLNIILPLAHSHFIASFNAF